MGTKKKVEKKRLGKDGLLAILQRRRASGWLVTELVEFTGLTQATVSRHLKALSLEKRAEATVANKKSGALRWKPLA